MRLRALRFIVALTGSSALVLTSIIAGMSQSQTLYRYSPFAISTYSELRIGYEMPPVQMLRMGGGRRGPNEKLKIGVSRLRNETEKNVRAVKFKSFIFNRRDLDEAVETVPTPVISLDIPALSQIECDILILYADDVPLLAYKPDEEYRLEVAVAEVHYDDGTIWEAKNLPGKLVPSKMREADQWSTPGSGSMSARLPKFSGRVQQNVRKAKVQDARKKPSKLCISA